MTDQSDRTPRIGLTVEEAAEALGIDRHKLGAMVRAGAVPHMKLGTRVLIGRRALEDWLTEQCRQGVSQTDVSLPPVRRLRRKSQP